MKSVWTERSYQVGNGDFDPGQFLTVCPAPDFPDSGVLLGAIGAKAEGAFGKLWLQGSTEYMRAIGEAIIKCCDDVERESKDR